VDLTLPDFRKGSFPDQSSLSRNRLLSGRKPSPDVSFRRPMQIAAGRYLLSGEKLPFRSVVNCVCE